MGKLLDILRGAAPRLAGLLIGPDRVRAVQEIGRALLGRADASEDELVEALERDPALLVELRQIEGELLTRLEVIHQADRASAREREVAVRDATPRILALGYMLGFFAVLAATFAVAVPEPSRPLVNVLLGALSGGVVQILNYYFGSSAGSSRKTEMMEKLYYQDRR